MGNQTSSISGLGTPDEKLSARQRYKSRLAKAYNISESSILDVPTTTEETTADSLGLMFRVEDGADAVASRAHYVFVSHGFAPEVGTELVMRIAPLTNSQSIGEFVKSVSDRCVMANFVSFPSPTTID